MYRARVVHSFMSYPFSKTVFIFLRNGTHIVIMTFLLRNMDNPLSPRHEMDISFISSALGNDENPHDPRTNE